MTRLTHCLLSRRSLPTAWLVTGLTSLVAGLSTAAPLPVTVPEAVGMSGARLAQIRPVLEKAIDERAFPGAVVLIARHGQVVYAEAFGERKPGQTMREDAIFRIYSMTKPLVSVAAMMLVENGTLELTDPVGKFLPGFDAMTVGAQDSAGGGTTMTTVPAARPMTVQDLLRHTSGLGYGETLARGEISSAYARAGTYRPDVPFDARHVTPAEEVARMASIPLVHEPGTTWNYGLSTDMLGRVIEAASGERLGDFMRTRVFAPLEMQDTGFTVPAADRDRLAEAFPRDRVSDEAITLIDVSVVPANDSGGAGGVSTAADYLRFCQMLLNGGILDGQRVLSPSSVRLMTSDHLGGYIAQPQEPGELLLGVKGYTFGLGFAVRREDGLAAVPGSKGDFTWGGYAGTYFWVDPTEDLAAVLMTQAPSTERTYYRRLLRQLVYQAIVDD